MKKKAQEWFHTTIIFFHFDFYISRLEYAIYMGGPTSGRAMVGGSIAEEGALGPDKDMFMLLQRLYILYLLYSYILYLLYSKITHKFTKSSKVCTTQHTFFVIYYEQDSWKPGWIEH